MHSVGIRKVLIESGPVARPITVITTTDTRHHGQVDDSMLDHGVLIVCPNGNDHRRAFLAIEHIVALVPD